MRENSVDKIVVNLCAYMKNTKEEKIIEEKMLEVLEENSHDKEKIFEVFLNLFEEYAPNDVKQQIYNQINEMF